MKILVAADARWVREQVRAALVSPGQEVIEVVRGQDVRGAVAEHHPDLVVLDLQIGNMGGIATALNLEQEFEGSETKRPPILLLLDRPADVPLARRTNVEGWLVKPLDAFRLRRSARALLAGDTYREPSGLAV